MDEISIYRNERKYIISYQDYISLSKKLSVLLKSDVNNTKDGYIIRSLYFDSINNNDLCTKLSGEESRKKIRLRIYENYSDKCKLEMKKKIGDCQKKISILISKDDAKSLINGDYSVLLKYSSNTSSLEFYKVMTTGLYKPVSIIEYNRLAYIYPEYNTRITFDINIKHSESNIDLFSKKISYIPDFYDRVILEVKYDQKLMGFISKILNNYNLTNVSVSKYVMGRKNVLDFIF